MHKIAACSSKLPRSDRPGSQNKNRMSTTESLNQLKAHQSPVKMDKCLHGSRSRTAVAAGHFNCYNFNKFKLFVCLVTLLLVNLQFTGAGYQGHPQQAPPTSLTIKNVNNKYNTTYACEGSQISISCDRPGTEINVIRSNFGRFSITICNSQGVLDWSVNCFSKNTVELIKRACNGQRQCLLQASTDLFGNPCPSTYKYLEVHYECRAKEPSDSLVDLLPSSPAPALFNSLPKIKPPIVNSNLDADVNSSSQNKRHKVSPPSIIIPDNPLLPHHPPSHKPSIPLVPLYTTPASVGHKVTASSPDKDEADLFYNNDNPTRSTMVASPFGDRTSKSSEKENEPVARPTGALFCPSTFERGLNWNRTEIETYATQPCPPGSTGLAQWFCSPPTNNPNDLPTSANEPHWLPAQPIFAQCQSNWLTQISRRMGSGESALLLSEELSNLIAETNQLYGGDIRGITELLRQLLQPLELLIAQHHQQEQTKIAKEMLAVSVFLFPSSCFPLRSFGFFTLFFQPARV